MRKEASISPTSLIHHCSSYKSVEILYEDNHLIAVNKKPSDLSQRDKTKDPSLIEKVKLYLKEKYQKENDAFLGLIHRLDRPVSGVILFAKTSKALSRCNEMIKKKEIKKTYLAIVEKRPPKDKDKLIHYLIKDHDKNKSFCFLNERKGSKESILDYLLIKSFKHYHLLKILPKSGRHHQIRTQLSFVGCPIKGDIKYGAKRTNPSPGIYLHAQKLEFIHPIRKEEIKIKAPVPLDPLWKLIDNP